MKKVIPVFIAVALILLIGGVYVGRQAFDRYAYGKERADLNEYFGVAGADDVAVFLNDARIDVQARRIGGGVYLPLEDVDAFLNSRFYYGVADGTLVYTLPDEIVTVAVGTDTWDAGDGSGAQTIAVEEDGTLWVLVGYVAEYSAFTWEFFGADDAPARLRLVTEWGAFAQATVTKNTELRVLGGVKSEILRDLKKKDRVVVLEQMETWSKVRTEDAYIGYVENKRLSEPITMESIAPTFREEEFTSIRKPYPINLAWHAIYSMAGNDTLDELIAATNAGEDHGLNTIAPTWFALSDGEGNVTSYASSAYVERAHALGLEVWAMVDNFNNEGADTASTLSRAASRKNLTDRLIAEVLAAGADGINVDFEGVPVSSGEDFIQWIRELSISCRREGLVLSIDNYVPMGSLNEHYDRAEQGVVADYIVIMAYDEHYRGSAEAGSVASIGYVEDGIRRTAAEVPAEKIIGGIPFYTRVWATKTDGEVSSDALTMPAAKAWVEQRGVTLTWDDVTCQNYGEIKDGDGTLRQIWMEDAESIRTKITVMRTFDIAGVAAWQLGFETPDVWSVIAQALTN